MLQPYYLVAFTVIIFAITILQSLQQEKILVYKFILSVLYLFISIVLAVSGDPLLNTNTMELTYTIFTVFVLVVFVWQLYVSFKNATLKSNHYELFVKAIKNSKFNVYYIVDQHEKIRDVSLGFLQEISLEKEEVIGKKLYQVLNKSIRIKQIDGEEATNKTFQQWASEYKKTVEPNQATIQDIAFLNAMGETTHFHLIVQPVYVLGSYKGRIVVGEKKTDLEMMAVEKELEQSNHELDSIRQKFIAILELSEEGLYSVDFKSQKIWMSSFLTKLLQLGLDELDIEAFKALIHADDLEKRQLLIHRLSEENPTYEMTYRIKSKDAYIWIREKGKKLFDDTEHEIIMGVMTEVKTKHFMASEIQVLDEVKTYHHVVPFLSKRKLENKYFEVLYVSLYNLSQINDRYGRDVGNMFISEYVKQLKKTFITESGEMFRMSGSSFIVVITDPRKIEMFESGLQTKGPFMDVQMNYGNIQTELKVHAVIMSHQYMKDVDQTLLRLRDTLRVLGTSMRPEPVIRLNE
ncbi:MAG: diguanylate cyclase domain-containing protein [Acholeplasmataceae bacterium]